MTSLFRTWPGAGPGAKDAAGDLRAPAIGASAAPLFIAIGGTAELCFLAWLLIKAVNAPAPGGQAPAIAQPGEPPLSAAARARR